MMNTWLMRRPARRPPSRATTAASSSSVCRLPFINSSALPSRTSSTALRAALPASGASTIRARDTSRLDFRAISSIVFAGPTSSGSIRRFAPASSTDSSADFSQG